MPQRLRDSHDQLVIANERSTLAIDLEFRDGGATAPLVTPTSATWSLVDDAGAIVNSRDAVALTVVSGLATIVLTGADLAVAGSVELDRHVTVRAVYNSATYGSNLSLTEEFTIRLAPLRGVPAGG